MLRDLQYIECVTRLANPKFDESKSIDENKLAGQEKFVDQIIYVQPQDITMFYRLHDENDTACAFVRGMTDLPVAVKGVNLKKLAGAIKNF